MNESSDQALPESLAEGRAPSDAPTAVGWRPPVVIKVIAAWELVGGAVLAVLWLQAIARGTKPGWPIQVVFEGVLAATALAGVTLWKGEPPGFLASCMLQLAQIVRVVSRSFAFEFLLGPSVTLGVPAGRTPHLFLEFRAAFGLYFGNIPEAAHAGFAINVVPIVVLIALLRFQAKSGQPWLRPRERRAPWDRAQIIGAYQVAAGALGVLNATSGWPHAMLNLLLSIVVIGSGVALVQRFRFSERVGVAVNAIQVPALGAAQWMYLVRSGVSCVTALTWGASSGLRFQFDVGSTINSELAAGVDGFVGINITALMLAWMLLNYRRDEPAPSGLERRLFLSQRR
jgi:hypothetical protein